MNGASLWIPPLVILASALGLIAWHVRVWRRARAEEGLPEEDVQFYWRQCRRRVQMSAMLAILAVGMLVEPWVSSPVIQLILGLLMLLLLVWLGLLALGDLILTRHHYERLHDECVVQRVKLEIEARRLRGLVGNGRPPKTPPDSDLDSDPDFDPDRDAPTPD